jgi:hypothetical protein
MTVVAGAMSAAFAVRAGVTMMPLRGTVEDLSSGAGADEAMRDSLFVTGTLNVRAVSSPARRGLGSEPGAMLMSGSEPAVV